MANRLSELAKDETRKDLPAQIKAAVIRTTAEDVSDTLYVTITADSPTRLRGPCVGWQRRGDVLPAAGDLAAVVQLDDTSIWIIAWAPLDGSGGT